MYYIWCCNRRPSAILGIWFVYYGTGSFKREARETPSPCLIEMIHTNIMMLQLLNVKTALRGGTQCHADISESTILHIPKHKDIRATSSPIYEQLTGVLLRKSMTNFTIKL